MVGQTGVGEGNENVRVMENILHKECSIEMAIFASILPSATLLVKQVALVGWEGCSVVTPLTAIIQTIWNFQLLYSCSSAAVKLYSVCLSVALLLTPLLLRCPLVPAHKGIRRGLARSCIVVWYYCCCGLTAEEAEAAL